MQQASLLPEGPAVTKAAVLEDQYRYALTREWDASVARLCYVMPNSGARW